MVIIIGWTITIIGELCLVTAENCNWILCVLIPAQLLVEQHCVICDTIMKPSTFIIALIMTFIW